MLCSPVRRRFRMFWLLPTVPRLFPVRSIGAARRFPPARTDSTSSGRAWRSSCRKRPYRCRWRRRNISRGSSDFPPRSRSESPAPDGISNLPDTAGLPKAWHISRFPERELKSAVRGTASTTDRCRRSHRPAGLCSRDGDRKILQLQRRRYMRFR